MEKEIKKESKQLENSLYKERFQFILQINDNFICQRYFKINGFTNEALESADFKNVMDEVVFMIQNDLVSKSRIYEWYTQNGPLKLTGFVKNIEDYTPAERNFILCGEEDGELKCENGDVITKTFFRGEDIEDDVYIDNDRPEPNEFVFKFSFLVDDKVYYERIWDGNVYPKYVRNSVDLTNSDVLYRGKDPLSLYFNLAIIRYMTVDKSDLVYHIIKKICYTLSSAFTEDKNEYTKKVYYFNDDKTKEAKAYYCSTYNKNYINGWRVATEQKTREYINSLFPSNGQIDYINKYL